MKAKILDRREEKGAVCYLCSISLEDYITGLPLTFKDYEIQRQIVNNVYLDRLVETVLEKRHIPPIVLVLEKGKVGKLKILEIVKFKILDGLQRTYRLKVIRDTITICLEKLVNDEESLSMPRFQLSRRFSKDLTACGSSVPLLMRIFEFYKKFGERELLNTFRENDQWFEIWSDLTQGEIIKKMLTLNAGHKPVSPRHQLELLFLNFLPQLKEKFNIVRDKEASSFSYTKQRKVGEFQFAHIITSLLSFYAGKPVTTSTGLIQDIQEIEDSGEETYLGDVKPDFVDEFVNTIVVIDKAVYKEFDEIGRQWMGREVSLAGIFGGVGSFAEEKNIEKTEALKSFAKIVKDNTKVLNLQGFEDARNSLELSKINFGKVNREAVFEAIKAIMKGSKAPKTTNWKELLGSRS